ncbi:predicted protein [Histoplasma mississippiense (nom. inval.)]|uniref:predicted protein n=1 Tax=Ajellomyces capsulatus (strain NAm1 / WU24) TaxID=2059318 RepID=UPI000157CFE2|nr:predicted protein [Histoplasma mississippiense (nom. inval.)]EDN11202.1 predicted protein [Histoplasma mississippiense (nom. inval.)]
MYSVCPDKRQSDSLLSTFSSLVGAGAVHYGKLFHRERERVCAFVEASHTNKPRPSSVAYAPNDLIKLGQVIVNPRIPYQRLAEPLPLEGKLIPRKAAVAEWSVSRVNSNAANAGVFAHMLGLLTAKASAKHSQKETSKWEGTLLETSFIELDENPEYVQQTATQVPAVSKWLREDRLFGGTVYMITGIKTAIKPGKATYAAVTERDIAAKLEATLALDPGTGGVRRRKSGPKRGIIPLEISIYRARRKIVSCSRINCANSTLGGILSFIL